MRRGTLWLVAVLITASCAATADEPAPAPSVSLSSTTSEAPLPTASASTTTPLLRPHGGEVVIGLVGDERFGDDPATLNPVIRLWDPINRAVHVGVASVDPVTMEYVPDVVTELPSVANGMVVLHDDGSSTVTYRIRPDARWEDGTPISGDDFAFTLDTFLDPELGLFDDIYRDVVPGSVIVEAKSFSFDLPYASPYVWDLFAHLVPRHQVEGTDFAADWNDRLWYSGGPFRLGEYRPEDGVLRLVRNENYWRSDPATGQQLPYLDAVEYRNYPDFEAAYEAFANREIDILASREVGDATLGDGAEELVFVTPNVELLAFQLGPRRLDANPGSLTHEVDFRRAVAYAVDRDAIAAALGLTEVVDSYVEVASPSVASSPWARYGHDPERARTLLSGLCDRLGRDCDADPPVAVLASTDRPARQTVTAMVATMLGDVGIETRVELSTSAEFFGDGIGAQQLTGDGRLMRGTWDISEWAYILNPGASGLVGFSWLFSMDPAFPEFLSWMRWCTPEVTGVPDDPATPGDDTAINHPAGSGCDEFSDRYAEIHAALATTAGVEDLTNLLHEAETILADRMIVLPLFQNPTSTLVWSDEIAGYVPTSRNIGYEDVWQIDRWYRADAG